MSIGATKDILCAIEPLKHFVAPKLLIGRLLRFVEEEGFLRLTKELGRFTMDELCSKAERNFGYIIKEPVRKRMVFNLLNILIEMGQIGKNGSGYHQINDKRIDLLEFDIGAVEKLKGLFDSELSFYSDCIEYAGIFLRGGPHLYSFDSEWDEVWEKFLGNYEFSVARRLLLQYLRIEDDSSFRILDLCYGKGHGLELICSLYPRTKATAIDFTDVFQNKAREKIEMVQKENGFRVKELLPVDWIQWKGFGDRLPFEDKTFDAIFFACGDSYIPPHLRENVYKDIYRVLKPGGGLGIMTRSYPDQEGKHITNPWARMIVYIHDFAEGVCKNWYGFYGIEETIQMFMRLGFLPRAPFFSRFSILDYTLWGLERPVNV